jgi:hypothetical protein
LIDYAVSNAQTAATAKSGYFFNLAGLANSYTAGGSPATFNQSGVRNFCSIEDGVVRYNAGAAGSAPMVVPATCVGWSNLN